MLHYFLIENMKVYLRGFLISGMFMSDQRLRSSCSLSDGKHNNNITSHTKKQDRRSQDEMRI